MAPALTAHGQPTGELGTGQADSDKSQDLAARTVPVSAQPRLVDGARCAAARGGLALGHLGD
jgi:hypothetical protein